MPDEMEQIEARLAAYVDGTLQPAQRAEIEAYLKANPTHGKLISELQSIKSAVASLPREKAPAEVLDTLQSHMERHSLLDGVEDAAATMRVNHWPQLGAVAAVLLLAAGLGLLIYQVLPKPKTGIAILSASTQSTDVDLTVRDDAVRSKEKTLKDKSDSVKDLRVAEGPLTGSAGKTSTPATPEVAGVSIAAATPAKADAEAQALARNQSQTLSNYNSNIGVNGPAETAMQTQQNVALNGVNESNATANVGVNADAPAASRMRVVVVTTDDPTITQNLVAGYFAQKQMSMDRASDGGAIVPSAQPLRFSAGISSTQPAGAQGGGWSGGTHLPHLGIADLPAGGRPMVVRGLSVSQIDEAEAFINLQRPARQSARSYWQPAATSGKLEQTNSTQPSTQRLLVGQAGESLYFNLAATNPSTAPTTTAPTGDNRATAFRSQDPTTQPDSDLAKATAPAADAAAADLLVVVVPAPATQPAATSPTTRPINLP